MLSYYMRNRGWLALRGVISILFGLVALVRPLTTLSILVIFFGAFVLADGVFAIIAAFRAPADHPRRWILLVEGGLGVIVGLYALLFPPAAILTVILLVAFWAVLTGVLKIMTAIALRKEVANEWMLLLSGGASILLGCLLVAFPRAGALVWAYLIAAYALLSGIILLMMALRLGSYGHNAPAAPIH